MLQAHIVQDLGTYTKPASMRIAALQRGCQSAIKRMQTVAKESFFRLQSLSGQQQIWSRLVLLVLIGASGTACQTCLCLTAMPTVTLMPRPPTMMHAMNRIELH